MENKSEIVIYKSDDGSTAIRVQLQEETVWLTQKQMAELFKTRPQNITIHLRNIFKEGELKESATCKDYLQVQKEGKREVKRIQLFYNLDAIRLHCLDRRKMNHLKVHSVPSTRPLIKRNYIAVWKKKRHTCYTLW